MNPARERRQFPDLREDIGEDPAYYLDAPIIRRGRMMRARIRGIDFFDVLSAWKAVERRLDRGPRDRVIGWLNEREAYLEEHGERPDRGGRRELRDVEPVETVRYDENGRPYRLRQGRSGRRINYVDQEATA